MDLPVALIDIVSLLVFLFLVSVCSDVHSMTKFIGATELRV